MPDAPRRGEVWWVAFDPSIGGGIQKTRPAVIVSNDAANRVLSRIQVLPLTTNVSRVHASEALVTLNGDHRKVMADQIFAASKLRLKGRIGLLSRADLAAVERVVRVQLGL